MEDEILYGSLTPVEALAFFSQKKLLPTRRWTDLLGAEHDKAFVVAGATRMALLADLKSAVEKAIASGTTLEEFRRDFDAAVKSHGWTYRGERGWRTRVIYQTNLRTAYQAGRFAQMQEVKEARPYWLYRHGGSQRPRPDHLSWDGLVLRADDPWWKSHYPPNGWGCSCSVFALDEREVKRRGLKVAEKAPDGDTYEVVDKETGEVMELPQGVGLGWDYTPGEAWLRSQTPQFVDAWPRSASPLPVVRVFNDRLGPRELPAPRKLPASTILPGDLDDAKYFDAFERALGDRLQNGVLEDVAGEHLAISRALFEDRQGRLKIRKRDRHLYVQLLARTLADPDEIWVRIEPINAVAGQYVTFRRYVARFEVEGQDAPGFVLFEYANGAWTGTTAFQADDLAYIENQRIGIRIYRRK